jgi:transposase
VQIDGSYLFGRARKIVSFDAIDDCSRYLYGDIYGREDAKSAINFVNKLVMITPFKIKAVRVDNHYGKELREHCKKLGIRVIEIEPYSPEQNGKVERFHKTVKEEFYWKHCSFQDSLAKLKYKYKLYQHHYNTKRRHGVDRITPAQKIATTKLKSLRFINPHNVILTLQQYTF